MWQNAQDTYLESRILSADPVELTAMLYEGAVTAVKDARRHLADGEIAARARSISKASAILIELTTSLDHERGGKFSANLAQLYDYMLRRLTEANLQQSDSILEEVLRLLGTLTEGWEGVKAQKVTVTPKAQPAPPVAASWEQPGSGQSEFSSVWSEAEAPATSYGRSWEQASQVAESAPTYTSSWGTPLTEPPAPVPETTWQPPAEPETPVSATPWEGAASYANAWVPQEVTSGSYSQHDWSL